MIYFDNSATTLIKPPEVAEAVAFAVNNLGNAGRSFYAWAMRASREVYKTRAAIAKLIGIDDPLRVAFTSSATEGLNLVIAGLIGRHDSVITTITEHNSVLRPLYSTGCDIDFMGCDDSGVLQTHELEHLIKPQTRFLVCTHGSNVTGNVTDAYGLYELCKANNIVMILDISQTFGAVPVKADMADIFCFTGHKSLFGPMGTGGVIVNGSFNFKQVKTGGAGANSFDQFQSGEMPDVFEAGTINSHGIYGLQKGVGFINKLGIDVIFEREQRLVRMFYDGIKRFQQVKIYGDFTRQNRLPVVSINITGISAPELAERLYAQYGIATRAGSHCAPLLHKRFGTCEAGMVRFSFSYFNTEDEINAGVSAIKGIIASV